MLNMRCKICSSNFSLLKQEKFPRVLTKCGHTFCDQCIEAQLTFPNQLKCYECGKVSEVDESKKFPLNETLMGILQASYKNGSNGQKQKEICKWHGRRLQAYCESDGSTLCLECVLGEHKSHKLISIDQKVLKEKQSLRMSYESISKSEEQIRNIRSQCASLVDKLQLDFNEFIFQINLTTKTIINQLQEIQHTFILQAQTTLQKLTQNLNSTQTLIKDKQNFYKQLKSIYQNLNIKQGLSFLSQLNSARFLKQNSVLKQKFSLPYQKISLRKQDLLNEFIKSLQQILTFEKKKNSVKNSNNNLNQSSIQTNSKNTEKKVKIKVKNQTSIHTEESPNRKFNKNISSLQKNSKSPQILEVNLVEKYEMHQQSKNMKKKSPIVHNGNQRKSSKIQYEIKSEATGVKKGPKQQMEINQIEFINKVDFPQMSPSKQLIGLQVSTNTNKILEDNLLNSKISSSSLGIFSTSLLNESHLIASPSNHKYQSFSAQTPCSIKSFMESSRFTTINEPKDQTLLKDSRSSFSMFSLQQKILHFGGLRNNSISCLKINPDTNGSIKLSSEIIGEGILRSKCQCVILKNYDAKKCLILGGKDENGERKSTVIEFDIKQKKVQKSIFELVEAISGFGAVVNQKKLYVFGGSTNTALKSLHQYKVGKNGFEVKKLSPMINSRDELGFALGFDGYLYVAGGINSSNAILNSCEKYCFQTNKWTSISAMKTPRRSFTLVSLPNGLYAIGGHDGKQFLKSVEMYDFDSQSWMDICPMSQPRFTHTAVSTSDYQNIIVFGGYEVDPLRTVEVYNVLQKQWTKCEAVDIERYLHCSILIQD